MPADFCSGTINVLKIILEYHLCTCYQFQNNDVSVTKVTMTDKDCSKISLLETYFPDAEHILCHFHVLKAVDAWLNTLKEIDGVKKERKNYIREKFPKVMYAGTKIVGWIQPSQPIRR